MMKRDPFEWLELFKDPLLSFLNEMENYMNIKKEVTVKNARHAFEYLQLINDSEEDKRSDLLKEFGKRPGMDLLLSLNYSPRIKLDLPEGAPVNEDGSPLYKQDFQTHTDLMHPLASLIGRLKVCMPTHPAKKRDKEKVFVQVLEWLAPQEGVVLIAAKDKKLQDLYPNITSELVSSVFPNYVK